MGTRTETLRQDLAHAMRTGPFSAVLNLAFESSGMSLEQAQLALAESGVHVSSSTLSYWRRGRSRPERPTSLQAVAFLEEILGLPARALTAQLGPRKPRGRWLDHAPDRLDPSTGWDRHEIDQVSRMTIMYRMYRDLAEPPQLKAIRGCRLGRSAPTDRDLLYFLASTFRARLVKDLPASKQHASPVLRQFAHRSKALLVELAELSLECAQLVIADDGEGSPVLPSWFLVEVSRDLPRLVAARA